MGGSLLAQSGYQIELDVNGFTGSEAYLAYYYGEKQYIKDTVAAAGGHFVFQGEESLDPGIYLVVFPPKNNYFEIIVDQDQQFTIETDTADFIANARITGSQDNEVFFGDLQFLAAQRSKMTRLQEQLGAAEEGTPAYQQIQSEIARINEEVQAQRLSLAQNHPDLLYSKVIQAMKEPEIPAEIEAEGQEAVFAYYRNAYLEEVDFQDPRLVRTPVLYNKINTYLERLTYKVPDSVIVAIDNIVDRSRGNDEVFQFLVITLLNKYAESKIMGMDAVYVHMVEKYYMSGDAFWADEETIEKMSERALAISPTIIGKLAPNFRVQDIDGNWQHLHGVPGQYTILYFWDYDCGHCKKVTPQLAELHQDYIEHDVSFFSVSINGDVDVWKEKVEEYGLQNAINVQDHRRQSGFDGMYDVRSTPRIFILDADKKIIAKQISVDQVAEILNHELGLDPPAEDQESSDEE